MPTKQPDSVANSLFVPFWQRGLAALLVAFILFGLFWGGAQPAAAGLLQPPVDKLAHLALYALLTWGGWYVLGGSRPILALALPALIGLMDELRQGGLPGRTMDMWDWGVDLLAAGLMAALLHRIAINKNARR